MTTYKKIHKILEADQKDREFLKKNNYDKAYFTAIAIRDYNRSEQIIDLLQGNPKLTKKAMFEVAVILHHSPSLKFSQLAKQLSLDSLKLGFIRSKNLLEIIETDQKVMEDILKSKDPKKM